MSKVIWFTGLSGSGKTTIAKALKEELEHRGKTVNILDGDVIREKLHKQLGFTREDIRTNNRLIANLALQQKNKADFVLIPIISPYREDRTMAKQIIGEGFIELYVKCSLGQCTQRDAKGLYQKAFRGEIPNFIGVAKSNPYEEPLKPDIIIDTEKMDIEKSVKSLIAVLLKDEF